MGGSESLIASVFSSVAGAVFGQSDNSDALEKKRKAREAEQLREEAEERRRDREKVIEARGLEKKRKEGGTLSKGAVSLVDEPEVSARTLKTKLGE